MERSSKIPSKEHLRMDVSHSTAYANLLRHSPRDREQISRLISRIQLDQEHGHSLNAAAAHCDVPRSSAQRWVRNRINLEQRSGMEPETVEFFRITPRARVPT